MDDPDLEIHVKIELPAGVTPEEVELLAAVLPDLLKDLVWLQDYKE